MNDVKLYQACKFFFDINLYNTNIFFNATTRGYLSWFSFELDALLHIRPFLSPFAIICSWVGSKEDYHDVFPDRINVKYHRTILDAHNQHNIIIHEDYVKIILGSRVKVL
jgi:hypothetical protein